ncbi:efflux RND transporter periplasmic adaptor subunit [Pelagibacterium lentulum]|uniref:MexE family multidrug efflux RND transporter periplasmic adaptor subunit n=1 Tax=Pelagibacterium lentulum TaxID=2029865 RepID=A0A916RN99_9HYPH|nr:efflux RND transporter periplasmic adaptor subunit [Pelagibacterium lentulum]GGA62833.1 MexE family multidrug efflux RND transporter periplasmic adaptor subunit [Pelagibacterium lentulum]
MDKSSGSSYTLNHTPPSQPQTTEDRPRRRFGLLSALARILVAIAVLVGTGLYVWSLVNQRPAPPSRQNIERTFTVTVQDVEYDAHTASISTYGQIAAARTIDLRAQVQGRVVEVSPDFTLGGLVEAGDVLARIDPFAYEGALLEARANLADAELALREAEQAHALEERNIEAASEALETARTDLERARSLLASGSVTQQTVDTRALTVSERSQALNQRETNLFTLSAQITRQTALIERARYQVEVAERDLANTEITAPFTGIVTEQSITPGGYISANDVIGGLYDTAALDVNFTISDRQYGELVAAGLANRPLAVTWDLDPEPITVSGTISRTAPQVDAATGGVTLLARLDAEGAQMLRPGTFVSVKIEGITYENTLRVPETAVYNDNHVYVIRDDRMASVPVRILARDNAQLIVSANPDEGERIITSRISQAGNGVAVRVEGEDEPQSGGPGGWGGGPGGGGRPGGN